MNITHNFSSVLLNSTYLGMASGPTQWPVPSGMIQALTPLWTGAAVTLSD